MSEDDVTALRTRLEELEELLELRREEDDIRDTEFRSLQLEVALKERYIKRLERMGNEALGLKDVHIRNLEAQIAHLTASSDEQTPPDSTEGADPVRG